jgi:23S rRNA pseudouridine1911/1915/1917 synthase
MKKYCFITEENDENIRLDNYLSNILSDISRTKIQEEIKNGNILVNSERKKPSYKLQSDEKIEVNLNEIKETIILPQDIKLEIIYEDDNMLVVNKPSGMLTHPTNIELENTLLNALLYKYGENLSDINGVFRRGILHRLDRNTSGLLMVAKNNLTHAFLAEQIKQKKIVKKYLAVVSGIIKDDFGSINLPIARHPKLPKMAVLENGKESLTEFKVLERFKNETYLELDLKTGRTHQIRVHLSYLKHPIINDTLYCSNNFKVKTQEQVLQSYKLLFTKPFSNDIIKLEIEPDEKIKKVLTYLKNKK